MINAEDVFGLMFRLRGSLSRNQHGMLHEGLFSRAHAGTKVLVKYSVWNLRVGREGGGRGGRAGGRRSWWLCDVSKGDDV